MAEVPPPANVTAAETGDIFLVSTEPLEPGALQARVVDPTWGGLASFFGVVRSPNRGVIVHHIDYEGYQEMIVTQMRQVATALRAEADLGRILIAHRLGRLVPGDVSIAVVVASPHRSDALTACQRGIDLSKELLPVWKYEVGADGSNWVAGSSRASRPL